MYSINESASKNKYDSIEKKLIKFIAITAILKANLLDIELPGMHSRLKIPIKRKQTIVKNRRNHYED